MLIPMLKVDYVAVYDSGEVVHFDINDILPRYENIWRTVNGMSFLESRVRNVLGHNNFEVKSHYGYEEDDHITECGITTYLQILSEYTQYRF